MKNTTIARKGFDYNALADKATRATLRQEATCIKAAVKRTHDNIIEIGNRLIHAKEVAGHGGFVAWVEAEFAMEYHTAKRFMNVAEAFGKIDINVNFGSLPNTALYALSAPSVDDETRAVALELVASGELKTTADAKALIEAAKPAQSPEIDGESEQSSDAREADEAEQLRAIEETQAGAGVSSMAPPNDDEDFDDDDPFANENDTDAFADTPEVKNDESPESDTLENRVKNATVTHDTLNSAPKEADLSDADWLESLPLWRVLKQQKHAGIFLKRDALKFRKNWKIVEKMARAFKSLVYETNEAAMGTNAIREIVAFPHPRDWQIHAPCRGNGCQKCGYAGYDTSGAGISAMRVESGEVTL